MSRRGFTLIELLIVIGVIGLLMAIALPAFQMMQAQGRRTQCLTNLRELGGALIQYQTQHKVFPPALINPGSFCAGGSCPDPPPARIAPVLDAAQFPAGAKNVTLNRTGWTLILPFIEQGNLYSRYNFDLASGPSSFNSGAQWPVATNGSLGSSSFCGENATVVGFRLDVFVCPSDGSPWEGTYDAFSNGPFSRSNAAPGNYVFSTGEYDERANTYGYYADPQKRLWARNLNPGTSFPPLGAFGVNGAARAPFPDGESKTILIGEALRKKEPFPASGGNPVHQELANAGGFWGAGVYRSVTAQVYPIDALEAANDPDDPRAKRYADLYQDVNPLHYQINSKGVGGKYPPPGVFSSGHGGGANFIFADGNGKFLSDSIDLRVLYKLVTVDAAEWPIWKGQRKKEFVEVP